METFLCLLHVLFRQAGATVAAVATRRPKRWAELIAFARQSAGTLLVPVSPNQAVNNDEEKRNHGRHRDKKMIKDLIFLCDEFGSLDFLEDPAIEMAPKLG